MSDWGATHSTVQAANAGLDQEFYEERYFASALKAAVRERRGLRSAHRRHGASHPAQPRCGGAPWTEPRPCSLSTPRRGSPSPSASPKAASCCFRIATDCCRFDAEGLRKIAVIGRRADVGVLAGGGSSCVESIGGVTVDDTPPGTAPELVMFSSTVWHHSSPVKAIAAMAPSAKVEFASGDDADAAARPGRVRRRGDRVRLADADGRKGPSKPVAAGSARTT